MNLGSQEPASELQAEGSGDERSIETQRPEGTGQSQKE